MTSKPIRVAFSGAGFRIPAHIGALQAIIDAGYSPEQIIGTSAGSIVGALYACGMSMAEMKELAMTHDWTSIMSWSPMAWRKLGYSNGENLLEFLKEKTNSRCFRDLSIDLRVVASNLSANCSLIFSKETTPDVLVAEAVRASASLPYVFSLCNFKGQWLCDGGVVDNIACDLLTIGDDVLRLGVQLVSQEQPLKPNVRFSIPSLALRLVDLLMSACESAHVTAGQAAGANVAFVECGYASTLARNAPIEVRERLYADGYVATAAILPKQVSLGELVAGPKATV